MGDVMLRILAMIGSIIVIFIGALYELEIKVQAVAMGFLLVIASGTDPLLLLREWRNKGDDKNDKNSK